MAPNAYWKPVGEWWDGYDGQEDVVMDDFYGWLKWSFLLNLLDRYPMLVPIKGGTKEFVAKRVFITSNKKPEMWYPNQIDIAPLVRRLEHVEEIL